MKLRLRLNCALSCATYSAKAPSLVPVARVIGVRTFLVTFEARFHRVAPSPIGEVGQRIETQLARGGFIQSRRRAQRLSGATTVTPSEVTPRDTARQGDSTG